MPVYSTCINFIGDGSMDSPGHCAQFCTYTFMEHVTHKKLCVVTLDKRLTGEKKFSLRESMLPERNRVFTLKKT